jgi:hypothetical protein
VSARASVVAALLAALALTSCGGSRPSAQATAATTRPAESQATVRTANCRLWNVLGAGDRKRLVVGLRTFFGGSVDAPGEHGQVLPDARAYTLLTSYCRQSFASAFMLYRLYGNAAAFNPGG